MNDNKSEFTKMAIRYSSNQSYCKDKLNYITHLLYKNKSK